MIKYRFLILVATICVVCLPIATTQAASDNTYPIFCIYFGVKAYNQDGDFTGLREIICKKMRISFSRHLLWPMEMDDSDFSSIEFPIPEDHSFGIVSTVDGELEVIGTSKLPLVPPEGWEKDSPRCELFALIDIGISNVLYSGLRVEKNETTWQPRGIGAATEKGNLFALQRPSTC